MLNKTRGQLAEQLIVHTLEQKGYIICARNYQQRFGEIDIIARKGNAVTFVEVKFRNNPLFDMGTIITRSKQKKMIAVAKYFMAAHNLDSHTIQFDVAFVSKNGNTFSTEYIANAFNE